jgi:alkanesulfonate monooxygenase SsuD/methylene tetrahydromethanopterin reductase-like flavin-dependent oxidoreductase (luciferase family)
MTADRDLEYGAHLPLIGLGEPRSLPALTPYVRAAARLGYRSLCANDHLVFSRPWLDGPTALAALIEASQDMKLVTTVGLPVLRGPVQLAKTLAAIDILSGGRLIAGVGPGSSAGDYAAVGLRVEERWRRFDEALRALRALLHGDSAGFEGEFYSTSGVLLEPGPVQRPGPPVWVASWARRRGCGGSPAWATDGWRPPTTPRPTGSARAWTGSPRSDGAPARRRRRSRVHLPRPGCTSPRTVARPSG